MYLIMKDDYYRELLREEGMSAYVHSDVMNRFLRKHAAYWTQ
jgi:hypothetical protein